MAAKTAPRRTAYSNEKREYAEQCMVPENNLSKTTTMKMRVLHISHTDIRSDSRILKEMDAVATIRGTQVVGIGAEDRDGAPPANKQHALEVRAIRPFTRRLRALPRPIYLALAFFELSLRLIWLGARLKPRLVHCHDTLVLPAGVLIKLFTGARLVYDAHELESDKNGQTQTLSQATWLMEEACWRWVDGFITVSESIKDWYFERLSEKASAVILNSPIYTVKEIGRTAKVNDHFRQKFNIPHNSLVFLYVGILGKGRGIEALLDVFPAFSSTAHLVCMGYGELGSAIAESASQHANIHLHPPVAHHLVVEYASSADVGLCFIENVSLSDYLCLPNKLFEYAFANLAVLASDFPEIRRTVEQYALGSVCQPDRGAIQDAVAAFIASPSAQRPANDLFALSWDHQAQKLVSLYETLLPQLRHSAQIH